MVNVLVCVKRVPDSTEEIVLSEDGQGVDGTRSGFTMSAHEECAVELAVQSVGDGQATVLTLGDAEAAEQLRDGAGGRVHRRHPRARRSAAVRPDRRRPRDRVGGP